MADEADKTNAPDRDALRAMVETYRKDAEYFRQYDVALQGVKTFPEDAFFRHRAVLALANAGALAKARAVFDELKLDEFSTDNADIAALDARLLKDEGWAADPRHRRVLLDMSADAYFDIAQREINRGQSGYYPLDNAAQLYLLSGDPERAEACAMDVLAELDRVDAEPGADERGDAPWRAASRLNATMVRGAFDAVKGLGPKVAEKLRHDWSALGTTYRHLLRLAEHHGAGADHIEPLRPAPVLQYCGMVARPDGVPGGLISSAVASVDNAISQHFDETPYSFAFGSLGAGSDILIAEQCLKRGIELTAILPCDLEDFVSVVVRPGGEEWVERFWAVHAKLTSSNKTGQIVFATPERLNRDYSIFPYALRIAMGMTVKRARHIGAESRQIAVWDGTRSGRSHGVDAYMDIWREAVKRETDGMAMPDERRASEVRRRQTIIWPDDVPTSPPYPPAPSAEQGRRQARAMVFMDFSGFSRVKDIQTPRFVELMLGAVGDVMAAHGDSILVRNTWGDGVFFVTTRAHEAATIALEIKDRVATLPRARVGLPDTLSIRIGAHLGPVYSLEDPIQGTPNFFGAHVTQAARVEPKVPVGDIYVTEPFAAALALDRPFEFICELGGSIELAKDYGQARVFSLRRAPTDWTDGLPGHRAR